MLEWRPNVGSQEEFHRRSEYEVLFGGAAGGGKSDSLLTEAARQINKKYYRALLLRRTFPELEKSLILRSFEFFSGQGHWQGTNKRWVFRQKDWAPNEYSFIEFGHLESEKDVHKYQSAEYDYIGFDELTSFTEFQYLYLLSRNRGTRPWIKRYVRSATNPGNIGHSWVKRRFIDGVDCELVKEEEYQRIKRILKNGTIEFEPQKIKIWKDKATGLLRTFIPAKVWDNPPLITQDPLYIQRLESLPEAERKALLEGDWNVFSGQFFREWNNSKHVVEPFEIPDSWKRFRSIDYGRTAPFCCKWYALDHDGNVWVYREYYQAGRDADKNAEVVKELSKDEKYVYTVADSSIFSKTGHGETIAEILGRKGINCIPSSKDRMAGWAVMHQYLYWDEHTEPKIRYFNTCRDSIRTIPQLIHDDKKPEDLNTLGEDHAADTDRYFLQTLRERSTKPPLNDTQKKLLRLKQMEEYDLSNLNKFYANLD